MSNERRIRNLSMVDVFEALPREELGALVRSCRLAEYATGETVFGPEAGVERLFVLEEGRVRLYRVGARGQEITLAVLSSGTVFGRLGPADRTQGAYAQAMARSLVSTLRQEDLQRLVMRRPEVGLALASLADERLSLSEDRAAELVHKEVPARLASLLLRLLEHEGVVTPEGYKIPTPYTHHQLGTMIGANREAVTRAFSRLREAGAVEVHRRLVRAPDLDPSGTPRRQNGDPNRASRVAGEPRAARLPHGRPEAERGLYALLRSSEFRWTWAREA